MTPCGTNECDCNHLFILLLSDFCCLPVSQPTVLRASLAAQWLRLCASTAGDTGSVPAQGGSTCRECGQRGKKPTAVVPLCVCLLVWVPLQLGSLKAAQILAWVVFGWGLFVMMARHDTVQLVKQVLYQAVFGSILRIRKVWQRRKCSVKNGILTISHATVSVSARSSPLCLWCLLATWSRKQMPDSLPQSVYCVGFSQRV